ncbi:Uncharacterised protein [Klebsiella quasipneumoniae]|uniref:hypothetical protein n=1 Tax=Klebsiella quasipneumoniae TaxID=1463165 RepID=UPI0012560FF2|nr:hypothetical protein [Klebsiella quasipneumoniae]HCB0348680.1 hypothetical protein [Klebsiella pneumoniae]HCI7049145.1 hypothetical protein [Klebsiella quasipneumoniae subsp. similipneumoniae]EIY5063461.1 hypothetical protein [Klebsiella quasipneumoniae]VAP80913.1 Uncharacterised protein [Klebsiella quasipneumoniae]VAP86956.1 Uncharacterised protein [Klebsiella quasipneumoniae]
MTTNSGFDSFVETISTHKDVIADIADAGLEAAEKIPFFGWAVKAWNIKNTFQEKKLARNVREFLRNSSVDDAKKFISKFSSDEEKEELCDSLIQVLIDSEKPLKAKLTSKIVNAIDEGHLTVSEAHQLLLIILNASIPALEAIDTFYKNNPKGYTRTLNEDASTYGPLLMSIGVFYVHGDMSRVTELGKKLYVNAFV